MRIREGKHAYDLDQPRDPRTEVRSKWRYTIFRVDPIEKVLSSGEADTRKEAEKPKRAGHLLRSRSSKPTRRID